VPDLEQVYDALATAIDTAGPGKSELFLVKLALLNANALGDAAACSRPRWTPRSKTFEGAWQRVKT
jgi:hypothetical protein